MDDKELADAVVALGVGQHMTGGRSGLYGIGPHGSMSADKWVRFWPVAGALMDWQCNFEVHHAGDEYVMDIGIPGSHRRAAATNESLPRAIIEACVEALKQEDGDE